MADPLTEAMKRTMLGSKSFFPAARMSERSDLLQDVEGTFYGGGNAPPTPSPSPTPNPPWYRRIFGGGQPSPSPTPSPAEAQQMRMNEFVFPAANQTSIFSLANPPRSLYRQPKTVNTGIQRLSPMSVSAFELSWPTPRLSLMRSKNQTYYNPMLQIPQFSERQDEFRF